MSTTDLKGRTFFVTGASSGIGRSAAEVLAARGGTVVFATRSEGKTRPVMDGIRAQHPEADLHFLQVDFADLASVKRAAESFLASGRKLDVLINNAGIAGGRGLTQDGFEITLGTNHLGPFLLTELLLPRLIEAPQGRIVNVASRAHTRVRPIDLGAFKRATTAVGERLEMYGVSKLMNVLHAKELTRRLAGTRVTTYALHPGVVASDVWREIPRLIQPIMKLFMITNEEGAKTTIYCATAPELSTTSGRYYDQCREISPSKLANDEALAKELFVRSEELIKEALSRR